MEHVPDWSKIEPPEPNKINPEFQIGDFVETLNKFPTYGVNGKIIKIDTSDRLPIYTIQLRNGNEKEVNEWQIKRLEGKI